MKKLSIIITVALSFSGCGREIPQLLYPVPTILLQDGSETGIDLSVYKQSPETVLAVLPVADLDLRFVPAVDSLYLRPRDGAPALLNLPLLADGLRYDLLVKIRRMIRHTFTYEPDPNDTLVVVMGGFNDWSRTALPLSDTNGDGLLEQTVYLKPERHEYKFVVNRVELIDPANPVFISNNIGGWNSILDLSDHRPPPAGAFIKHTGHGQRLEFDYLVTDGELPALLQVLVDNTLLTDQEVDQKPDGSVVVNVSGWEQGLLRISGLDGAGRVIPENQTIIKNGRLLDCNAEPDDWHFAVLYSLMVDRFLDGDPVNTSKAGDADLHPLADFHGGDIAGINAKLEEGYFRDLGINAIWISPVSRQPEGAYVESIPPHRKFTGYHGYWPVRAREVDPRFGTAGELRRLVELAHEQGIRVILDFVSNHVHEEHEYCQSHPEWFGSMYLPDGTVNIRNWSNETRLTTWFDEFIPSFDYPAAPAAEDQVVEDALWWLETFDFDGFRQDAVKHVPHTFWKKLTAAMKTRFPERDFYQIGESFGSDELIKSYVNPGELNSQFNFAIYFNARGPFSADLADFGYLANILQDNREIFGPVNLMGNLTSSHDQVRFMGFADGQMSFGDNGTERAFNDPPGAVRNGTSYDKLVNFTAFNLAVPGVPVIYYGEEIGLMGAADPDNRRPLRFGGELTGPEKNTLARIAALTRLRRQYPALSIGDYIPLLVDGPLLVFGRIYFDERIIVAFNQSVGERTVTVDWPFPATGAVDLLNDETVQIANRQLELTLPAYGHRIVILN